MKNSENTKIDILCEELNHYLKGRFGYKRNPAEVGNFGKTIVAERKKFQIYLRLDEHNENIKTASSIVIAQIFFQSTRVGHGHSLLEFLCIIAERLRIIEIGIESANSKSGNFAKKYGFTSLDDGSSWSINIEDLSYRLTNT